jgi:small subunit ribosomal protein S5
VGYGFAKANEVSDAIRKGSESARKNIYTIEMEGSSIPHEVYVEWDGAKILLKPAAAGTGVIAGSKVRSVLELGGVKDVVAKNLGSSNPLNQVKAIFKALHQLKNREKNLAERKGT